MTKDEAYDVIKQSYRGDYKLKILEVIERKELKMVRYRVKAGRDGFTEWRIKCWGTKAMSGWDYPYRRKW